MRKLSASAMRDLEGKYRAERETLAYHHILKAIVTGGSSKWGTLQRVGSVYDSGDSWVWQLAFTPRLRDGVIMETFRSKASGDETVRCFFLNDVRESFQNHSFSSDTVTGKFQTLYCHAVEMEMLKQNEVAA